MKHLIFLVLHLIAASQLLAIDIQIEARGPGTVSISPEKQSYTEGEIVTLTATPDGGAFVEFWEGPGSDPVRSSDASIEITVSAESEGTWKAFFTEGERVWSENFENGWGSWYADNGVWQVGEPTTGPGSAFEGVNVAATGLSANYPDNTDSRLVSPAMDLPALGAGEALELRFMQWFDYDGGNEFDKGHVEISVWGGSSWGEWERVATPVDAHGHTWDRVYNSGWSRGAAYLSAYAGQRVRVAFYHVAGQDNHNYNPSRSGWFLDDVEVWRGVPQMPQQEGFEGGWGDWHADHGVWQIGEPGSGPGSAYQGSLVAGTDLSTNYSQQTDSRLVSPAFDLPDLGAGESLELRFMQWFDYDGGRSFYDKGHVEVSVWDGSSWGDWERVATPVDAHGHTWDRVYSSGWSRGAAYLSAYEGQRVRVAFYHVAGQDNHNYNPSRSGWFIDDVEVWRGVPQMPQQEGFEGGWGDWHADHGVWQIGEPGSGPGSAYQGSLVAGTDLSTNYSQQTDSRLVSPAFDLPDLGAGEALELRFMQWFDYDGGRSFYDKGHVEVSVWGGTSWGGWERVATPVDAHGHTWDRVYSSGWSRGAAYLSAYAGQRVRVAFYHVAGQDDHNYNPSRSGWFIDDVEVWRGVPQMPQQEGFEGGWGDWHADHGVWQIGEPGSGPGSAYQGSLVAGTDLSTNYSQQTDSRLVSPAFDLPDLGAGEALELRFMQWFDYDGGRSFYDKGHVEVSVWDGTSWGGWERVATPVDAHGHTWDRVYSSGWSRGAAYLSAYAGQRVRVAFLHVAGQDNHNYNPSRSGWFLDDVEVWRGVPQMPQQEGFEGGWGDWHADHGVWQIGEPGSGPGSAYQGSLVAGTDLSTNYSQQTDSRLVSPAFDLPDLGAGEALELRFMQWFDYDGGRSFYDKGHVEVSVWGGFSWGGWERVATPVDAHGSTWDRVYSSGWSRGAAYLSAYEGQRVRVAFYHVAGQDDHNYNPSRSGWFIDDVEVWRGVPQMPPLEDFEAGWWDWHADNGVWQIGIPTSGPSSAYGGAQVAATILNGGIGDNVDSRLVSPFFFVATAEHSPNIRFWHWYKFGSSESGSVQIRLEGEDWQTISTTYTGTSGSWSPTQIDLLPYAGQSIQMGFLLEEPDGSGDVGWYIDDIRIRPSPELAPSYSVYRSIGTAGDFIDGVEIVWSDVYASQFDTSYEVWRSGTDEFAEATLLADGLTELQYFDSSAETAVDYYYWVRGLRDGEPTPFALTVSGYRGVAVPEDVKATQGNFKDRVHITWPRVAGIETYSIYRHTANIPGGAKKIASGHTISEFEDLTIEPGRNYYYWVTSEALDKESFFSNVALGYAVGDGLNTVEATDGLHRNRVEITWDALDGADSYSVWRSTEEDALSAVEIASGILETSYSDLQTEEEVVYSYWVRALQIDNLTGFSNRDSGYRPEVPESGLVAWGDNEFGQTNVPHTDIITVSGAPGGGRILPLDSHLDEIIAIAGGVAHSLAVRVDGKVFGWGRNNFGQSDPPESLVAIDVAVGYDHSLALLPDGSVVGWGRDTFGKATPPSGLGLVIDVAAGADHSIALLTDGSVAGWGGNDYGQLDIPEDLSGVVQIASGGHHNLALKADGTVVVWGDNLYGQLDMPEGLASVVRIAAGWNHNLAVLADGSLVGWGDNRSGQLDAPASLGSAPSSGSGVRVFSESPAAEVGTIVDISAGLFHSIALLVDGTTELWGDNSESQSTEPDGLNPISQIDAGEEHNMVVEGTPSPSIHGLIPADSRIELGSDTLLSVRATGASDLAYQWYHNGSPIEGATREVLHLGDIRARGKGGYAVEVLSGGESVTSEEVPVVVTIGGKLAGFINGSAASAVAGTDDSWLSVGLDTDPPGKGIVYKLEGESASALGSGTHVVDAYIHDDEYASEGHEGVMLTVENFETGSDNFRITDGGGMTVVEYLAVDGFACELQSSEDMRTWSALDRIDEGDGLMHRYETDSPGRYYRVVFTMPNNP